MKNRIVALVIAGIMATSLCACGKTAETGTDAQTENAVQEEPAQEEAADTTEAEAEESSEEASVEESTGETAESEETAEEIFYAPDIDITGCDTFTQIIDEKLTDGMGYANETLDQTDVFLVCSSAYDNLDGNMAAIDSAIFIYKDGVPFEVGKVESGGTANPLAIKDGKLYVGTHHNMTKYTITDDKLVVMEQADVTYDADGNGTYTYTSDDGGDYSNMDSAEAEKIFNQLYEEYFDATVVNFSVVGGGEAASATTEGALPAYEYPGPEVFYYEVYKAVINEFGASYDPADVGIPSINIAAEDYSDPEDMRIYGDFCYFNYKLNGQTLETQSGGSYPGCIHVKNTDEGYEVTNIEVVADGSDFDESAKEIMGDHYDEFIKLFSDDKAKEQTRLQIIANYVAANGLNIIEVQDFGWDPVPLPEENIDTFYSDL